MSAQLKTPGHRMQIECVMYVQFTSCIQMEATALTGKRKYTK